MSKIVNVTFSGNTFATTERLWQYDYGQKLLISDLDLPEFYEVHFASSADGNAIVNVGDATGVDIPDKFIRVHGYIYAWLFLHDDTAEGHTKYQIKIPVEKRAKPPEDPPSSEQRDALAQAIDALNTATGQAEEAAGEAEEHKISAEEAATLSQSWAEGGTGTRMNEDYDNSKFYAQVAQQGAAKSGYAYFYTDPETGEIIVTVADNLNEDVRFEINETTGEMEVEFL